MQLSGGETIQSQSNYSQGKKSINTTDDLIFVVGKTNPVTFLNLFEKCSDVKNHKDKIFKIRNFVNDEHRKELSTLLFTSNWETVKHTVLKKYSLGFTENRKREMTFAFNEDTSLRSFVQRKMKAMSTYTSLSLQNQLDMILIDLPNEISNLFLIKNKTNCTKNEVLKFCDSIQEYVEDMNINTDNPTPTSHSSAQQEITQDLEIFSCNSIGESTEEDSICVRRGRSSNSANISNTGRRAKKRRVPPKILETISEDSKNNT